MLSPPSNLRFPKEPLIMKDYKRDGNGNIYTTDGSLLQVDKNKNLLRNTDKNLILLDGSIIEVSKEGENIGRPLDEGKTPIQIDEHRKLQGFPLYKDGVLM